MLKRVVVGTTLTGLTALVVYGWPDVHRYMKIRRM
ncbi:MAG: hypothetical protein JWO67_1375 [Streptosporangiaceae bacterium]|jgi:hypothetical protein|nr:hypothetical protein [Streptosporangiaceae bacterium]